ncbi:MAG: hypothetical protein ABW122_06905 [Ilumatobacteraceae bacterium]
MMLRFQWDALRRGDHILVHDPARPDLGLRPAEVVLVDTRPSGHDVAARYTDGDDSGRVVRPGRFAVHFDPAGQQDDCWRCGERAAS